MSFTAQQFKLALAKMHFAIVAQDLGTAACSWSIAKEYAAYLIAGTY